MDMNETAVMEAVWAEESVMEPQVAALKLLETFGVIARTMSPKDWHMQQDLRQEMALAVLMDTEARSASAFCMVAIWRAKSYLRAWLCNSKRPGCERHSRSVLDPALEEREREAAERAERVAAEFTRQNEDIRAG